ncbi:hypothetical protein FE374_05105 [Georgenia yuyongxinii]|uniref:Uncharacterized protein n=1 Tax=Georgenia yuyongxinii TaxID=2589797 RepID=A0A5B8C207_9MICO|nr:hypothetical protein [Georgenia yuyongxinii]QDC24090.1 hypothetical protein FE374_05105 [Georgenia yuyongxinii]
MATDGPILTASRTGTRRDALVALRDRLASALDETRSGRDLAALARRYVDTLADLAEIDGETPSPDTPLAQLRRERTARGAMVNDERSISDLTTRARYAARRRL